MSPSKDLIFFDIVVEDQFINDYSFYSRVISHSEYANSKISPNGITILLRNMDSDISSEVRLYQDLCVTDASARQDYSTNTLTTIEDFVIEDIVPIQEEFASIIAIQNEFLTATSNVLKNISQTILLNVDNDIIMDDNEPGEEYATITTIIPHEMATVTATIQQQHENDNPSPTQRPQFEPWYDSLNYMLLDATPTPQPSTSFDVYNTSFLLPQSSNTFVQQQEGDQQFATFLPPQAPNTFGNFLQQPPNTFDNASNPSYFLPSNFGCDFHPPTQIETIFNSTNAKYLKSILISKSLDSFNNALDGWMKSYILALKKRDKKVNSKEIVKKSLNYAQSLIIKSKLNDQNIRRNLKSLVKSKLQVLLN